MINDIRQFGSLVSMATYVLRPGGYSVIGRPDDQIAVVETKGQFYLPGGGQEAGETPTMPPYVKRWKNAACGFGLFNDLASRMNSSTQSLNKLISENGALFSGLN